MLFIKYPYDRHAIRVMNADIIVGHIPELFSKIYYAYPARGKIKEEKALKSHAWLPENVRFFFHSVDQFPIHIGILISRESYGVVSTNLAVIDLAGTLLYYYGSQNRL